MTAEDLESFMTAFDPDGEFQDDADALLASFEDDVQEVIGLLDQVLKRESSKEMLDCLKMAKEKMREWPG